MLTLAHVPVSSRAAAEIVSAFQNTMLENIIAAAFILIRVINNSFSSTALCTRIARVRFSTTANLRRLLYLLTVAALILALVYDLVLAANLFSFEKRALVATGIP